MDEALKQKVVETVRLASELLLRKNHSKAAADLKALQNKVLAELLERRVIAEHQKAAAARMLSDHASTLRLLSKLAAKAQELQANATKQPQQPAKVASLGYPSDSRSASGANTVRVTFIDAPTSKLRACDEFLLNCYKSRYAN